MGQLTFSVVRTHAGCPSGCGIFRTGPFLRQAVVRLERRRQIPNALAKSNMAPEGSGIEIDVAVNVAEKGVVIGKSVKREATVWPSNVAEKVPVNVSTLVSVLVSHTYPSTSKD